ncbi:MAG: FHA domain-containing protein [Deltaproteobacteria bacterium]|nr:FHA domain-containing protein [Deltaproteobacteria bacterium]
MFVLVARDASGRVVGSLNLDQARRYVGRSPECALTLPSTGVSRIHASVYYDGQAVVVNDEGSANGVRVDNHPISGPTLVGGGNVIQISEFTLRVEASSASQPPPQPSSPLVVAGAQQVDFDTQLEPMSATPVGFELLGCNGPYEGSRFAIDRPLMTVGRVEKSDIVIEEPSVSRRHAQLRIVEHSNRMTLLDLRSHNGTFVDGRRVKRIDVEIGSIIRFGDVAFRLERIDRGSRPKSEARPRLMLAAVAAILIIGAAAGAGYWRQHQRARAVPNQPKTNPLLQRTLQVREMLATVQQRIDSRNWSAAVDAADEVLKIDPLNTRAKDLRGQAIGELDHERNYNSGLRLFSVGGFDSLKRAKEVLKKIPADSAYHLEVRSKLRAIDEKLASGYRVEGVSRCKARYWEQCQAALCTYFTMVPIEEPIINEPRLRAMLVKAQRKLGRRAEPCKAPRLVGDQNRSEDQIAALAKRYEDPAVRKVVRLYVEGKIDAAVAGLKRLRGTSEQISLVKRQLLIARGKYLEGAGAHRERDADRADAAWQAARDADAQFVPKGVESYYSKQIKNSLASLYFELGEQQYKAERHKEAFKLWTKGKRANPRHDGVLSGLLRLESMAEKLVREAREAHGQGQKDLALRKLKLASAICQEERPLATEIEALLRAIQ